MLFFPGKMASFYGYDAIPVFTFFSFYSVLGIAGLPVLIWGFFKWFKQPGLYWYAIVFFGISISMYMNYPKPAPGIVADRFLFFASVGFAIFLAHILLYEQRSKRYVNNLRNLKPVQKSAAIIVLLAFTFITLSRNTEWKNKLVLFESDVKKYPESVKLSQLYSSEVLLELNREKSLIKENERIQKLSNCEKYLKNAIKIDSTCSSCYNNLSYVLLNYKNDVTEAMVYLQAAIRNGEQRKEILCNLGIAYYRTGNYTEAKKQLKLAIDLDYDNTFLAPYAALGDCYRKTGIDEGITFFTKLVQERPLSEPANLFLANLSVMNKDTLAGIKYYKKVLEIDPSNDEVKRFLDRLKSL